MNLHRSIGEIAMAAIPASVPSLFSIARPAGGLPPVKAPEKPANSFTKICKNPNKIPHRQPSSTLKNFWAPAPALSATPHLFFVSLGPFYG
jgi:hypothetical protein